MAATKIVIDDGTREYSITNQFDQEICKIHFRPADLAILDRYNDLMRDFDALVEPLKNLDLKNDGTASFDKDWEAVNQVETALKAKINALLDSDDADGIFAKRHAFSSVHGEFFCLAVLRAIRGIIEGAITEEAKLSEQRMGKYLQDIEEGGTNAGETAEGA